MTVPTATNTQTHPVANPAGTGRVWPGPSIEDAGHRDLASATIRAMPDVANRTSVSYSSATIPSRSSEESRTIPQNVTSAPQLGRVAHAESASTDSAEAVTSIQSRVEVVSTPVILPATRERQLSCPLRIVRIVDLATASTLTSSYS